MDLKRIIIYFKIIISWRLKQYEEMSRVACTIDLAENPTFAAEPRCDREPYNCRKMKISSVHNHQGRVYCRLDTLGSLHVCIHI